jgi:hypothetical protein
MGGNGRYYFLQTDHIDATETETWNEGRGFNPIGRFHIQPAAALVTCFFGVYDGDNFTISNLFMYNPSNVNVGLFGSVSGATILRIGLIDINFFSSRITNMGGLVGRSHVDSIIKHCFTTGVMTAVSDNPNFPSIGGLIGLSSRTTIEECFSTVQINNNATYGFVGGLVGWLSSISSLSNSFYKGFINSEIVRPTVGGLVGYSTPLSIQFCYVAGVSEFENVSGFIGQIGSGTVSNNFWDTETTGILQLYHQIGEFGTLTNNFGLSTVAMKTEARFINGGWDFENVWDIHPLVNNGYPFLRGLFEIPVEPEYLPPTNLNAVNEDNHILLTWDAPVLRYHAITGYNVYRDNVLVTTVSDSLHFRDFQVEDGSEYTYFITALYGENESEPSESVVISFVYVHEIEDTINPFSTQLFTNFPNPFNPETTIAFSLSNMENVEINVYNVRGQLVRRLVSGEHAAGRHSVVWNGRDDSNRQVSSGVYFYKMKAGEFTAIQKMLLMK